MASCMECFHYEVCKPMGIAMRNAMELGVLTKGVEHNCYIKCFKPIADVVEVKHAKWTKRGNEKKCSACEFIYYSNNDEWIYCPNCGAKMDGEGKQKNDFKE